MSLLKAPPCPGWCTDHRLEEDIDGSATDVHRATVTRGQVSLYIEDSPSWSDDERRQVVPPELPAGTWCDARYALDLAAALIEAARLVAGAPSA